MEDKRLEQKKEAWIKNIISIQNVSREKAEEMYVRINPFKVEILSDLNDRTIIKEGGVFIGTQN